MSIADLEMDIHSIILCISLFAATAGFALGRLTKPDVAPATGKKAIVAPVRTVEERVAFFQFTQLVLDVLPVLLRRYFKARWHATYNRHWSDCKEDGEAFWWGTFEEIPCTQVTVNEGSTVAVAVDGAMRVQGYGVRGMAPGDQILIGDEMYKVVSLKPTVVHLSRPVPASGTFPVRMQKIRGERNADSRMRRYFEPKVINGDVRDWDLSLLCFALLYSSHDLIPIGDGARQLVEELRDLRNNKLAHVERCSMEPHELAIAVRKMDSFVETCMPHELELWTEASRDILEGHPLQQGDSLQRVQCDPGHEAGEEIELQPQPYSQIAGFDSRQDAMDCDAIDSVSISVCPDASDYHALMDRMTTQQQLRFMDEWKARWLSEFSAMAITNPLTTFSIAAVRFT